MLHDCNANTKDAQTLTHPFFVVKKMIMFWKNATEGDMYSDMHHTHDQADKNRHQTIFFYFGMLMMKGDDRMNIVVVYYSWSNGNTKSIAEALAKAYTAPLVRIDTR